MVTATPCIAICLRNSSRDVTEVRGTVNSRTPSRGRCKRITTASPISSSRIRFTTYKSLWYIGVSSISPSSLRLRIYTPPFCPRKYGLGYSGMVYVLVGLLGKCRAGASTTLSDGAARSTLLPSVIGDLTFPQFGQSPHTSGLNSSKDVHRYGPLIPSILAAVSSGLYPS